MSSNKAANSALLGQILYSHRQDNDIIEKFVFSMHETSNGQMSATEDEFAELLPLYIRGVAKKKDILVLDRINECTEIETLIPLLLRLSQ